MAARNPRNPEVDRYVETVDPPLRAIVVALRTVIRAEAPELREKIKMGIPMYARNADVLYIAPYTRHVNLGFWRGARIRDATGLLEGTGKGLRHVKVRSPADARDPRIRALVRAAVEHDRA